MKSSTEEKNRKVKSVPAIPHAGEKPEKQIERAEPNPLMVTVLFAMGAAVLFLFYLMVRR